MKSKKSIKRTRGLHGARVFRATAVMVTMGIILGRGRRHVFGRYHAAPEYRCARRLDLGRLGRSLGTAQQGADRVVVDRHRRCGQLTPVPAGRSVQHDDRQPPHAQQRLLGVERRRSLLRAPRPDPWLDLLLGRQRRRIGLDAHNRPAAEQPRLRHARGRHAPTCAVAKHHGLRATRSRWRTSRRPSTTRWRRSSRRWRRAASSCSRRSRTGTSSGRPSEGLQDRRSPDPSGLRVPAALRARPGPSSSPDANPQSRSRTRSTRTTTCCKTAV